MQHNQDKQRNEQLSALLDNDMTEQELAQFMDDLKRDPLAEGETLQRYQLIGKTLRGELDSAAFIDVSAAVQRAIELESLPVSNVRVLRPRWLPSMQKLMRPAAGLAIAASVAMVTVVSVRVLQQNAPDTAPGQSMVEANTAPVVPVNAQRAQQVQVVAAGTLSTANAVTPTQASDNQMREYLIRHSGVAGQTTMQGVMPYARAVSFEEAGAH
ncbi:MAG: sigma-E factor negative regulatory protein [Gammaproteobacteria bacterium]|nr:sigma-E factor negative regulatory protein [Gammaproteobacteria bacterium]